MFLQENNSIIDADHQSKASQLPTIMERRVRKAPETNDKSDDSGDEMSIVTQTSPVNRIPFLQLLLILI